MKQLLWILTTAVSVACYAQNPDASKYARLIDTNDARKHLSILASDEFEGRETGTRGAEKAARYIADEFKKIGLKGPVKQSYYQQVDLFQNYTEVKSFKVNQTNFTFEKDFYFNGQPSAANIHTQEIVFVGYGIDSDEYSDLKNINITGKIVLFINKGEPFKNGKSLISNEENLSDWSSNKNKKIQSLQNKKPALILALSPDVANTLANYHPNPRLSLKKTIESAAKSHSPVVHISPLVANELLKSTGKTYEQLQQAIDQSGKPQSQVVKTNFMASFAPATKEIKADNVLGYLEGSDLKNELLVISAHYDHVGMLAAGASGDRIFNGADDDGSGTTAIIEIARAFSQAKKEGKSPRRSILFLAVCGEEKGLLGSEWYSLNPVFPLKNTVANLNIDMIGRVDDAHLNTPAYCYLIGSDKLSTELHQISEKANETYTKLLLDYKYNDPNDPERIYYRSDHYNFAKHGIPIIFYFNGVHEDYHQPGDEVDKIRFDLLVKRAKLVYFTAWEVANRTKRLVVDVTNDMPSSR